MRAAVILGLGCSPKNLKPFQTDRNIEWRMGMPSAGDAADVILLFGGDGTVHRHLGALVRLALPVMVVPVGSGNDFARALGLRRVRDSLAAWQKFCAGAGNVQAIDLGVVTPLESADGSASTAPQGRSIHELAGDSRPDSRYFSCVAGIGLDSEVARRAGRLPRWLRGHGGYALTLAPTIFRFAPFRMKISAPLEGIGVEGDERLAGGIEGSAKNESWTARSDRPTILAAFANGPVYGGGMKIAPRAKMDDGLLDVCVVAGVGPFKLFCLFPTVYYGRHLGIREVSYFSVSRARVQTETPLDVYADGEYVCQTPVEVGIQQGALRAIVHSSQTSF
ncbi:MAG TPA: diacylglycerol kinase family protein [Terriglobales bacterium]|nr:diacylglycerol kinase family protein [Terriglobales bacterium]